MPEDNGNTADRKVNIWTMGEICVLLRRTFNEFEVVIINIYHIDDELILWYTMEPVIAQFCGSNWKCYDLMMYWHWHQLAQSLFSLGIRVRVKIYPKIEIEIPRIGRSFCSILFGPQMDCSNLDRTRLCVAFFHKMSHRTKNKAPIESAPQTKFTPKKKTKKNHSNEQFLWLHLLFLLRWMAALRHFIPSENTKPQKNHT